MNFNLPGDQGNRGSITARPSNPGLNDRASLIAGISGSTETIQKIEDQGLLRQFRSEKFLIDLQDITDGYQMAYYPASQVSSEPDSQTGLYTFSGDPITVVEVTGGGGIYTVERNHNGSTDLVVYTDETSGSQNQWTMSRGMVDYTNFEIPNYDGDPLQVKQVEMVTEDSVVLRHVERVYRNFNAAGTDQWKLMEEVVDPNGAALTTTYTYETNYFTGSKTYGKLLEQVNSDGSWVRIDYNSDGYETKRVTPIGNNDVTTPDNQNRVVESTYVTHDGAIDDLTYRPWVARTVTESHAGTVVRRTFRVMAPEIRIVEQAAAGAGFGDSDNLRTTSHFHTSGSFNGLMYKMENPDGTLETRSYLISGTNLITSIERGEPDTAGSSVISGTRTITTTQRATNLRLSRQKVDIESDLLVYSESTPLSEFDEALRPLVINYHDNSQELRTYSCCTISERVDRDGVVTTYSHDERRRLIAETRDGITSHYEYDALDRRIKVTREGRDESLMVQRETAYDIAGRVISEKVPSPEGTGMAETTYSYTNNGLTTTITRPDGSTIIQERGKDGRLISVGGTGTHEVAYEYGTHASGTFTKEIHGHESVATYTNFLGQVFKVENADASFHEHEYNELGQRIRSTDPDGVSTLYAYNGRGERETMAIDRGGDGLIDPQTDTVRVTTREVTQRNGVTVQRETIEENGVVVSVNDQSTSGLKRWVESYGLETATLTVRDGDGMTTTTVTRPDDSQTVTTRENGRVTQTLHLDASETVLLEHLFSYDDHNRLTEIEESGVGVTIHAYNQADRRIATTTPNPGSSGDAQTTGRTYDIMGRVVEEIHPDSGITEHEYFPTGELKKTSGALTYTVEYTYDHRGRRATMTTEGQSGPQVTTWHYSPDRGFLVAKEYPDGNETTYTYTAAGRLETRTWERGVVTTYSYNDAGELVEVAYSDNTPTVSYTFDARGRRTEVADGISVRTFTFADHGAVLTETHTGGPFDGVVVEHDYDPLQRMSMVEAEHSSTTLFSHHYGYDGASRLETVTSGDLSVTYTYDPVLGVPEELHFTNDQTLVAETQMERDNLRRLTEISTFNGSEAFTSHAYTYNDLNQRVRADRHDGTWWDYEYDATGQVISARKRQVNDDPIPGQQFEYAFDGIGNRTESREGGDINGQNLPVRQYTSNNVNQYTSISIPGTVDIAGWADPQATVTVEAQSTVFSTDRNNGYFHRALSYDNSTSAVFDEATVVAVLSGAGPGGSDLVAEEDREITIAETPEVRNYDEDGNLTSDGLWLYEWDGENRLIAMESQLHIPDEQKRRLHFAYDGQSRRVSKEVHHWDDGVSDYVLEREVHFLWADWRMLGEVSGSSLSAGTFERSYVWGLDLSGSKEGAGTVGGLLWIEDHDAEEAHFVAYDGNGNVAALINADTATLSASYEYGPFGQVLEADGPYAATNRFRFSTKYEDHETGLNYYGFRYYDPETGRWPSRDPIEEEGGLNLYAMVANNPVNAWDYLGLEGVVRSNPPFKYRKDLKPGMWGNIEPSVIIDSECEECSNGCYRLNKKEFTIHVPPANIATHVTIDGFEYEIPSDQVAKTMAWETTRILILEEVYETYKDYLDIECLMPSLDACKDIQEQRHQTIRNVVDISQDFRADGFSNPFEKLDDIKNSGRF